MVHQLRYGDVAVARVGGALACVAMTLVLAVPSVPMTIIGFGLAGLGIVAAPGSFYGPAGARHVRMALTATDERVDAAVERLAG